MFSVAISLNQVLPPLIRAYRSQAGGPEILANYGASGTLRQQVEGGAPVDGVIYASAGPVDRLIKEGLADPASRLVVATNRLILIAPPGGPKLTFETIDHLPKGMMLAIGDPGSVPAGEYARQALQRLGKWDALQGRLVLGGDVGAVLHYARRGEVAAAIVYHTDIVGVNDVVVLDEAKGHWAPVALDVAAVVKGAAQADRARAFLGFLKTPQALQILSQYGFGPPPPAVARP